MPQLEYAMVVWSPLYKTSSPEGNDRSPENKQVFSNSSQVSYRFFQLVKGSQLCSPWLDKILTSTRVVTLLQICNKLDLMLMKHYAPNRCLYIKVAKLRTGVGSAETSYLQNCSVKLLKEHFKVQIFKGR